MGKQDTLLKAFLSDNTRFAELFNNALFGGRPVIQPGGLQAVDSNQSEVLALGKSAIEMLQKNRDIAKIYNDQLELVILGIENQNDVHYAMPMRVMVYDALSYERQYKEIGKGHRKKKDLSGAEKLSGFGKADYLIPVITLVVYYGTKPWDGPKDLSDMVRFPEGMQEFSSLVGQYPMHLLEVNSLDNLEAYHDDLKALLGFVKYQKDLEALKAFIEANKAYFEQVTKETFYTIDGVAEIKAFKEVIPDFEKQEVINMCEALQQLKNEGIQQGLERGMQRGMERGLERGMERGLERGMERGIQKGMEQAALNLLKMKMSVAVVQEATGLSEEEIKILVDQLSV